MKISVVIPAYNEERHVGACLKSIFLARIPELAEIIVVNNASTDNTADVVARFPEVQLLNEPEKGVTKARQMGIVAATGDVIAFIDADTEVPADWFKIIKNEFSSNPGLVSLTGLVTYSGLRPHEKLLVGIFWNLLAAPAYLLTGSMAIAGNLAVRKDALAAIGGFNTDIAFYGDDTDLARRLKKHGKVKFTRKLSVKTSGRRFRGEGVIRTGFRYAINYAWCAIFHHPITKKYRDIRN